MFIITKPSAINPLRNCIIGEGETKAEAWESAYGPKPWSKFCKQSAREAVCEQVTTDEYHERSNAEQGEDNDY